MYILDVVTSVAPDLSISLIRVTPSLANAQGKKCLVVRHDQEVMSLEVEGYTWRSNRPPPLYLYKTPEQLQLSDYYSCYQIVMPVPSSHIFENVLVMKAK